VDETPEYDITTKKSSDVLFTIGGFAGMTANVTEHFSIDLSYRFTTTPNVKVGYLSDMGTMLSHQLTVGAVWRW
jgi:opacity protein-like surface antigen